MRAQLGIETAKPVSGGCIHDCYRVTIAGEPRFLKVNEYGHADAFAAEAEGLSALRASGLRAPGPIAHGTAGGKAYLLLEYLEMKGKGDFAALGRMLAHAHRKPGPRFGWARDKGFDVAVPSMRLLENHKPQPSLLHGDLWSGNAGFAADGPVVFDPAVYYGDREADLAMTELLAAFRRSSTRPTTRSIP